MKPKLVVLGILLGLLAFAPSASADVIFTLGNTGSLDTTNILFKEGDSGSLITGYIGQTDVAVDFWSLTGQELYQHAKGQAMIQNNADPGTALLTSIALNVPGYTFGTFIMNPLNGSGWATVEALDNFGATYTYDLKNGSNYLSITTANGQTIQELTIKMAACDTNGENCVASPGFIEFKQPRIGLVQTECADNDPDCEPMPLVPEPATMVLLGSGLLGAGLLRRRRH